jgi:hypothetical protein
MGSGRGVASAHRARTRQATNNDGLPHGTAQRALPDLRIAWGSAGEARRRLELIEFMGQIFSRNLSLCILLHVPAALQGHDVVDRNVTRSTKDELMAHWGVTEYTF